jgi:uncharacterized protein (DUF608 family)
VREDLKGEEMAIKREKDGTVKYTKENLNYIAFPLGGMGAGMLCLEGSGGLTSVSIRHRPEILHQIVMFSAFSIKGETGCSRVLEGQVPRWKIFGQPGAGGGLGHTTFGLPRCDTEYFTARFPFATVRLDYPISSSPKPSPRRGGTLKVEVTGWSPFIPGDADNSSIPVAALEYTFINNGKRDIEGVYSFHSKNFLAEKTGGSVRAAEKGFILHQSGSKDAPWTEGNFSASVPGEKTGVDCRWFRGNWFDPLTILWKNIEKTSTIFNPPFKKGNPGPGGSLYVPVRIPAKSRKTVRLLLSWYVPESNLNIGENPSEKDKSFYQPWYAGRFKKIKDVSLYWDKNYDFLKKRTMQFSESFHKASIPSEITEAIAANLSILKSPTVLRQTDGRLWCWEGCNDNSGSCNGSCTHVWNYAQAIPHLFPQLERTLRQTEFNENQDKSGHQNFRAWLPIRTTDHKFHAASDGQLGGIMKVYRDWRISGDTQWLKGLWDKVKKSLNYCIETWDPEYKGILQEPHHNTYDIEFWGPDGMCGSFYLGALKAACLMAEALNDPVPLYKELYEKGRRYLEKHLFNGEYFYQDIRWKGLKTPDPTNKKDFASLEAMKIIKKEGPKYQYSEGCLSDGVLGVWIGAVCGIDNILDNKKVKKHLLSVYRYNFRRSLLNHFNPQRPGFALGDDGGLLLCTWTKGKKLSLPFPYSNEVWTGIEYQVASHLMMHGRIKEGLDIVRAARARYDGRKRNPFDEYECGHWYGRALSSYGILQGLTGIRYDAVEKTLYIKPVIRGDFSSFISTETGYGLAGIKNKKPFLKVYSGKIEVKKVIYSRIR